MDEDVKQRLMTAFVTFNFTFVIVMVALTMAGMFGGGLSLWSILFTRLLISALVGGLVGGGVFAVLHLTQR